MKTASYWISKYNLQPHPEGGYFRENYASSTTIDEKCLPKEFDGKRKLATSIYFLLHEKDVSKLHHLKSDEIWYYHFGSVVEVLVITPEGTLKKEYLGTNFDAGERLQIIIPAGCIFGARLLDQSSYSVMGCMVSPGFEFEDFTMPSRQELIQAFPQYEKEIIEFTNP